MKIVANPAEFNQHTGNTLERLIFNNRSWVLLIFLLVTLTSAWQLRELSVGASFDKMLPHDHPYIENYLENRDELRGLGDSVQVVVENPDGDIFDPEFLEHFANINDDIFIIPGVDRAWMKSIWTPVVRWVRVTERGFEGGPVIPGDFDGSPESIRHLRENIARADVVGSLVANDYRSGMIVIPLLPDADYYAVSKALDEVRAKYQGDDANIYIVGFAKLVGDLIDGLFKVMSFFLAAVLIAAVIIFSFSRCLVSTSLVLGCSTAAIIWQLAIVTYLEQPLDPFTVLVPFLVFAIGVSHGAQKMNGILQDIGKGNHKMVAARYTFRRLFVPGVTALVSDAVGFAVLMIIDIPVIRELAISASIGFGMLILTNLVVLPVLLSYTGVSKTAADRSLRAINHRSENRGLGSLALLTERKWAVRALSVAVVLAAGGLVVASKLQIGDLDQGAPELRADSRYNKDSSYISEHYGVSNDLFAVMVKTPSQECGSYRALVEMDRLGRRLSSVPGVQQTQSLADMVKLYTMGSFEGNPKWLTISDNAGLISPQISTALAWNSEMLNRDCSVMPVVAYLSDHKAATLERVVDEAAAFAEAHSTPDLQFLLAAGNAGVEAATNMIVRESSRIMMLCVYIAVGLLSLIVFRSWRAVVVALLPLMLTSILTEAFMVMLGIGMKVATLPVIALGVGIGVDYALYLLSVQLTQQRLGVSLRDAYRSALRFTGKVVGLVGVTLSAGVVTWVWSPIKFQADMGLLLTFVFLFNMLGALILIPALSHFLLRKPAKTENAKQDRSAGEAVRSTDPRMIQGETL
ncbi:hypothetical protein SAMN04487881_0725 [Marinobacter sp. es.048]|uniref:efflux RND transporter permease subunit n=1 Tax=Marinobacter sp. es.048 TaxID=1761795 RepID=UPI000B59778F|nr:MMPL family transporter [Marinobacter sp. es.048]SNC62743.1 hypothetical protein SAMN04487881_0725 [Marinobacter sp. es.048]